MVVSRDGIIISVAAFLIVTAILLSPIDDSDMTGLAYEGFSDPINTYTFNSNTNTVSTSDSAVYKYGYYSINGAAWQIFTLNGNILGGNWLTGVATKSLPDFGSGEHYIVIYSCTYINKAWDCHENQWQIKTINNAAQTPSCTLGTNTDCAYCGNICPSDYACINNQCTSTSKGTGRTFYVSSSTGSDSNTGTSISSPWQTLNRVNQEVLRAGDGVLFKRGDTFRGQLVPDSGSSSGRITYGAYGSGAKPKLLGSVDCTNGWTNVGTNIWQNSNSALNVDVGNLIFNNEQSCGIKQLSSSSPTLESQGEFWYDSTNHRVRLYSVGNPSTVYSHIECALKRNIIGYGAASYVNIENLDLRYGAAHGIGFHSGTNQITVRNCDISYIGGGDFTDSTGYVRYGNGIEFWESASNIIVENCKIDNIYDAAITTQGQSGGRTLSNAYINNNTISNSEYSFEYWFRDTTSRANNIFFENNTCIDAGKGFGHNQRPDNVNGRHLMISQNNAVTSNVFIRYNTFSEATESLIRVTDPPGTANFVIDYNRLHQSSGYIGELGWGSNNKYSTLSSWQQASGKDTHSVMI